MLTRSQAEARFLEKYLSGMVRKTRRAIFSAALKNQLTDSIFHRAIEGAYRREIESLHSITFALRPALKHMGFRLFKAGSPGHVFVTAVEPRLLPRSAVIEEIGEVFDYLQNNPGHTREQMIAELRPGKEMNDPEVANVLSPLRWLIERGHVIEFFDGTLAMPKQ